MHTIQKFAALSIAALSLSSCSNEMPVFVTHTKKKDGYRQLVCTKLYCRHKVWMENEGLGHYGNHEPAQDAAVASAEEPVMDALPIAAEVPVDLSPKPAMEATFSDAVDIRAAKVVSTNLAFAFDATSLSSDAKSQLKGLANLLAENPTYTIGVIGHTDNVGDPDYNLSLARQRASTVASYLMAQDVDVNRLLVTTQGMGNPLVSNRSAEGRASNRRVELIVNP